MDLKRWCRVLSHFSDSWRRGLLAHDLGYKERGGAFLGPQCKQVCGKAFPGLHPFGSECFLVPDVPSECWVLYRGVQGPSRRSGGPASGLPVPVPAE